MKKHIAFLLLLFTIVPITATIKWHTKEEINVPDLEGVTAWASCETEAEVKKIAKIKLDLDYYFEQYFTMETPINESRYEVFIKENTIIIYKMTEDSPVIECYVVYK